MLSFIMLWLDWTIVLQAVPGSSHGQRQKTLLSLYSNSVRYAFLSRLRWNWLAGLHCVKPRLRIKSILRPYQPLVENTYCALRTSQGQQWTYLLFQHPQHGHPNDCLGVGRNLMYFKKYGWCKSAYKCKVTTSSMWMYTEGVHNGIEIGLHHLTQFRQNHEVVKSTHHWLFRDILFQSFPRHHFQLNSHTRVQFSFLLSLFLLLV